MLTWHSFCTWIYCRIQANLCRWWNKPIASMSCPWRTCKPRSWKSRTKAESWACWCCCPVKWTVCRRWGLAFTGLHAVAYVPGDAVRCGLLTVWWQWLAELKHMTETWSQYAKCHSVIWQVHNSLHTAGQNNILMNLSNVSWQNNLPGCKHEGLTTVRISCVVQATHLKMKRLTYVTDTWKHLQVDSQTKREN